MSHNIYSRLVYARTWPFVGRVAYFLLKALGSEIPRSVQIGRNFHLVHGGFGVVIHPACVIGNNVRIYQGVTLGRGDTYKSAEKSQFKGIIVADNVIIGPGAKVLGTVGFLQIREGTVVGANAVLRNDTQKDEIWAGVPARCIGMRGDDGFS